MRFFRPESTAPAGSARAVAPHDTNALAGGTTRSIYVGGGGDLVLMLDDDSTSVSFKNVQAGTVLPVQARLVLATGTTATNILALY